jgi:hypothetical protein
MRKDVLEWTCTPGSYQITKALKQHQMFQIGKSANQSVECRAGDTAQVVEWKKEKERKKEGQRVLGLHPIFCYTGNPRCLSPGHNKYFGYCLEAHDHDSIKGSAPPCLAPLTGFIGSACNLIPFLLKSHPLQIFFFPTGTLACKSTRCIFNSIQVFSKLICWRPNPQYLRFWLYWGLGSLRWLS